MAQKCGGRILTDEEVHENVLKALSLEEKKDLRRLGKEYEDRRVDAVDNVCGEDGKPLAEMDAIVLKNKTSATNSLSQTEWASMEAAMPAEERQTHRNLQVYFMERAKAAGVKEQKEEEEEEDDPEMLALLGDGEVPEGGDADSDAEEDPRDAQRKKQEEEDKEAVGTVEKSKNWSSVNLAFQESKLNYRGSFSALSFTNWLWFRVVRPKLEETKSKLPELSDEEMDKYGIQDVEDVLSEFMPAMKKKEEKEDKKDKKDKDKDKDKKDKKDKEDDKKKDKKDDKKDSKKKKKDAVQLNAKEKVQVQNLIKNMIYGESGKNKSITTGWVNLIDEKDMPRLTPWEFQLAHIMRTSMAMEYSAKKKKEVPDLNLYYEMCQSLADAIGLIKKQYLHEFPQNSFEDVLPIQEALALQSRFREGSVTGAKFDLLWYLQNGAHLLAGSSFAKKHRTTVFKPFKIQELMIDAVLQPGPQLVFGIAPPGTGKTAVVSHILNLFPVHTLVFCCPALPVVLSVGRISNTLGIPYAFCKGRRITPSYSCGRGLGTHVDMPAEQNKPAQSAVESLRYAVVKLNLERKKKRLAEKKRKRSVGSVSPAGTAAAAAVPETPLAAMTWPRNQPVKQPEIVTAEDFIESLRGRDIKVILQGELIKEFVDHPIVWPSVNAMAESYRLAMENPELGSAVGFSGYRMSRFLHICESADDLVMQSQMQRELGRRTGTCFQRCVGQDASNAMWSTTYDIDQKHGTKYHARFVDFMKMAQSKNLVLGGAMTDVKGDRSLNPSEQPDPDMFVRVAERKPDGGVVLRGCKAHQTGNLNSHWMIIMPGGKMEKADKDYAIACAVPVDAPGLTYIYGRQSCDLRAMEPGDIDQGNAKFGGQETLTCFEDVYVPPEYVFMDGEVDFTQTLVERFTAYHRRSYVCKAGLGDVMLGAAATVAEYNGVAKASHIKDKLVEIAYLNENIAGTAMASSYGGQATPSGNFLPDVMMANICKHNVTKLPYEIARLAQDLAGGIIVTLPADKEFRNEVAAPLLEKYLKGKQGVTVENRRRILRLIENMTMGRNAVGYLSESLHGAGSPQAQRVLIQRLFDLEMKKRLAKNLAGIVE